MTKIGLFYGTQTGYTQTAAEMIQKNLRRLCCNSSDIRVELLTDRYNYIIIGRPTWNVGECMIGRFHDQLDKY